MANNDVFKCSHCNQTGIVESCIKVPVIHHGKPYDPIPFGSETRQMFRNFPERCSCCQVTQGSYHHPNCEWEECPVCGGQLFSCGCIDGEDK